jgi:tetrahydromethanopterin S-methyltransferase subunit B
MNVLEMATGSTAKKRSDFVMARIMEIASPVDKLEGAGRIREVAWGS